jgi:hypothetical protein
MKADDYGRFHADARLVRALCFPLSESIKADHVRKWLDELHRNGLLVRYEADGKELLSIVNFGQRLRQSRGKFPEPAGEASDWMPTSGNFRESAATCGELPPVPATSRLNRIEHEHEVEGKRKAPPRPSLSELSQFCKSEHLTEGDAEATFHKWEANGFTNNGKPIKNWQATIRAWKAAGFMPSQKKQGNGTPVLAGLTSRPLN